MLLCQLGKLQSCITICYRDERDNFLKELARENTQLLINSVWGLPTERVEEVIVAKFPPPTYKLPREKPLPTPKVLTKWEKYAKDKGRNNISSSECMAEDLDSFPAFFLKKLIRLLSPIFFRYARN